MVTAAIAGALVAPLVDGVGVAVVAACAALGVVLGGVVDRSSVRTVPGGVALGAGLALAALAAHGVARSRLGADLFGLVGALRLAQWSRLAGATLAVVASLRFVARRVPVVRGVELVVLAAAVVAPLAAHRGGFVARPLWLGDLAARAGIGPESALLTIGAVAALGLTAMLVIEGRRRIGVATWLAAPVVAALVVASVGVAGLPQVEPPADLGLTRWTDGDDALPHDPGSAPGDNPAGGDEARDAGAGPGSDGEPGDASTRPPTEGSPQDGAPRQGDGPGEAPSQPADHGPDGPRPTDGASPASPATPDANGPGEGAPPTDGPERPGGDGADAESATPEGPASEANDGPDDADGPGDPVADAADPSGSGDAAQGPTPMDPSGAAPDGADRATAEEGPTSAEGTASETTAADGAAQTDGSASDGTASDASSTESAAPDAPSDAEPADPSRATGTDTPPPPSGTPTDTPPPPSGTPTDSPPPPRSGSGDGTTDPPDAPPPQAPDLEDRRSGPTSAPRPMAVVVLGDDHEPPEQGWYLRQDAWASFTGNRLVTSRSVDAPQDLVRRFPVARTVVADPPPTTDRALVRGTVSLVTEHAAPFALANPVAFEPATNPDPTRFVRSWSFESLALAVEPATLIGRKPGDPTWSDVWWDEVLAGPDDPRWANLADEIVSTLPESLQSDPWAQAVAIKLWMDGEVTYSMQNTRLEGPDPAGDFLFGDRVGYCVHIAHAAVFLLRARGIPARVGTGYAVPASQRRGSVLVATSADAHAWPEVYLNGLGWVIIDIAPEQTDDPAGEPLDDAVFDRLAELARQDPVTETTDFAPPTRRWRPMQAARATARAIAFVLGLALLVLYAGKTWRRVAPRVARPAHAPRVAYRAALDALADLGIRRRFGETREAFAARVAPIAPSFAALTRTHLADALGPRRGGTTAPEARALAEVSARVGRESRASRPRWRRWLGALDPISFLRTR